MRKADTPFHKRQIIRMYYCGSKLPVGIRLWNQKKIDWTMEHVIIPQCTASNEGEISNVNNTYEFKYVSKDEIIWIIKDKEYTMKWQKEYDK